MADKKICPLLLSRIGGEDLVSLAREGVLPRREIAECIQGDCAWWAQVVSDIITDQGVIPGGRCAISVLAGYIAGWWHGRNKGSEVEYDVTKL